MDGLNFVTLATIIITSLVSYIGFNNQTFFDSWKFNVGAVLKANQWYRLLTSAFLHGDFMHLLFNMITLFFFSDIIATSLGLTQYLIVYLVAILAGSLLSLWMYRNNPYYSAIGASGGVSGILFAAIAINPHIGIYLYFIPIPIPGWIFAILYLAYSVYGMKSQLGNIGHAAHLGGAVAGLLLAILFSPEILTYNGLYIAIMALPLIVLAYYVYREK